MAMVCTHHRNSTYKGRLVLQTHFSCDTANLCKVVRELDRLHVQKWSAANLVFLMATGLLMSFSCGG